MKDNLGNPLDKFDKLKKSGNGMADTSNLDFGHVEAEDPIGCLVTIVLWIIIGFFGSIILWSVGAVIWAAILTIASLLYFIIFRAYRLIFRNSAICKNNFWKSAGIALLFTFLYTCWIYGIIFGIRFLNS